MKLNRILPLLTFFATSVLPATAKQGDGTDLPPDSQLRIGVKFRPPECPKKSTTGDNLVMHYTGSLYKDNKVFDSSLNRSDPFSFQVGTGSVIKGWDQGLLNMCIGEKRKLTIPSDLGYGDAGAGQDIPAGATLVFEVELLDISDAGDGMDQDDDYDPYNGSDPYDDSYGMDDIGAGDFGNGMDFGDEF